MAASTPKHCSHCRQKGSCASIGGEAFEKVGTAVGHEPAASILDPGIDQVDAATELRRIAKDALPANRMIQFGAPLRGPLGRLRCSLTVDEYMSELGRAHSRRIV